MYTQRGDAETSVSLPIRETSNRAIASKVKEHTRDFRPARTTRSHCICLPSLAAYLRRSSIVNIRCSRSDVQIFLTLLVLNSYLKLLNTRSTSLKDMFGKKLLEVPLTSSPVGLRLVDDTLQLVQTATAFDLGIQVSLGLQFGICGHGLTPTTMARFTDLSNELILAIRFHLRKPTDILSLALIDRRCCAMISPLLYEIVTLHLEDYLSIDQRYSDLKVQAKIFQLLRTQRHAHIRTLNVCASLGYDLSLPAKQLNLFRLLPHLKGLASLQLHILKSVNGTSVFPVWFLSKALMSTSGTLRCLVLCIQGREDHHLPIGNLRNLTALKHLCIQSSVSLGRPTTELQIASAADRGEELMRRAMVSELLPASLESLELHCCRDGSELKDGLLAQYVHGGRFQLCEFRHFSRRVVRRRLLRSVVVCWLPPRGYVQKVRDLQDHLDVAGNKTSHLGTGLGTLKSSHTGGVKIVSIV